MGYTISTHNGSNVSRQHNLRNPKVVAKQKHISREGTHETWVDKNPRKAYDELFGAAQEAYNRRQIAAGRPGRCIKSYYDEVANDSQKHSVYEMIVAIGSKFNPPPADVAKEILREFVDRWPERNDSLKLVGAYYHHDEEGVGHVHVDYVPVATGYKNGLAVQNGLVKALNAIGFETNNTRDTAQIQWEHRENRYLEQLCRERGLEIDHPLVAGRKHIETEQYKAERELDRTRARLNVEMGELRRAQADHDYLTQRFAKMLQEGNKRFEKYKTLLKQQDEQIAAKSEHIKALDEEIKYKESVYKIFGGDPELLPARDPAQDVGEAIDFDDLINR